MHYLLDLFLPAAKRLRTDQINEAQKFYLYHKAQAERHAALAAMYKEQGSRLVGEIAEVRVAATHGLEMSPSDLPPLNGLLEPGSVRQVR